VAGASAGWRLEARRRDALGLGHVGEPEAGGLEHAALA